MAAPALAVRCRGHTQSGSQSDAKVSSMKSKHARTPSTAEFRARLALRLRDRLPELRSAVATRVYAIADPHEVSDPAYLEGLNAALAAAVDYRLAVLEVGERRAPAVPEVLL